jgi:hypothetical protein
MTDEQTKIFLELIERITLALEDISDRLDLMRTK